MCALSHLVLIIFLRGRQGRENQSHFTREGMRLWETERLIEWVADPGPVKPLFFGLLLCQQQAVVKIPLSHAGAEGRAPALFWTYHAASLVPFKIQKYIKRGFLFLHSSRGLRMKVLLPNTYKANGMSLFFHYIGIWMNQLLLKLVDQE